MLINILITLLVILIIAGIVFLLIDMIWPGDARIKRLGMAIVALIILLYLLQAFGFLGSVNPRVFR